MKYDLKYYEGKDTSDYQYTDYKKALKIHDIKYLKSKYKKRVTQYLNSDDLDQLFDMEKIKINIHKIFKRIGLN